MQTKTLTYQSSKFFYRIAGAGKPLILIHGFAEDGDIWSNQINALQQYFQLIIPDLPGSGKSELIADMSIEGMAEVIKELITHELKFLRQTAEAEEAFVPIAGHSMGGYIALALAEKYPQLISSIALVHSTAFADSEEKKANRLKSIEFVKKNGAFEFLKAVITDLFTEEWAAANPEAIELQIEKCKSFSDEAIIQYYKTMINRPDRTEVLKNFNKPIHFIIGEQDKAIPFQQSLQQSYLPNQSYINILRNTAHMGMLEEQEKVNKILIDFMSANIT